MKQTTYTGNSIYQTIMQKLEELQDLSYAKDELCNNRDGIAYRVIDQEYDRVSKELQALKNTRYVTTL